MAGIITALGGLSAYVVGLVGDVATVIVAQPILLIPLGLALLVVLARLALPR